MRVTFDRALSKFVVYGTPAEIRTSAAFRNGKLDSRFECRDDGTLTTGNIGAIVRLKRFTDKIAEKLINQNLVKYYAVTNERLPKFLDPHQRAGVLWILGRSRSYLAHAPGAGKTLQAIVAARLTEAHGQALFIVPPSLTANWVREIERFTPLLDSGYWPNVSVVPESKHQEHMGWDADYIVCPDSMITKPWVLTRLIKMDKKFIAVDEASRFKEPTALRTIALFGGKKNDLKSPGIIKKARHVVLLDGSPMPNRPMELWAPTYAMAPETIDFMSEQDFGFRYCGAKVNDWGQWEFRHASNEDELKKKLQKNFMHVVSESELSHPERLRTILTMNEDPRTREFKAWESKFLSNVKLSDLDEGMNQGDIATHRRELGVRKIPFIARYVRERMESKRESILLFAWHREVCEGLSLALKEFHPALIMGGTKADDREKWFDAFQSGACRLIIGNIATMGRGHNLQRADRIVFGEYSWTDELNKQCEKRASRRGNTKAFTRCDYICVPNSMDEVILQSVFTKAKNVKRIVG